MSQLARLVGAFSPGHPLEHGGVTYVFAKIDQKTKAALEAAYYRRAREAVYAMKGELSAEEYGRQLDRVTDRYVRGEYGFPLGESLNYYTGDDGIAELVAAMTGKGVSECQALLDEREEDVVALVWCVLSQSSRGLKKKLLEAEGLPGERGQAMAALASLIESASTRTRPNGSAPPASPRPGPTPTSSPV